MRPVAEEPLLLRCDGVSFGSIVDEVTLEFRPGRLVALVGPNGAGKSTLMKLLSGYLRPTAGRVTLGGRDVHAIPGAQRGPLLGYLPQHVETSFPFTVLELVRMGALARGLSEREASREAMATLEEMGLGDLARRPYPVLSGGERRLTLAAKSLVQRPAWMLLDEPTEGMDWNNARKLIHVLAEAAASGVGVVVVVHDLNQVLLPHAWMALISEGRMVELAPALQFDVDLLSRAFGCRFHLVDVPAIGRKVLVQR